MRPFAPCFLLQRASLLAAAFLTATIASGAPVGMNGAGTYTQNFDTLPTATGTWADDSTLPNGTLPGWYALSSVAAPYPLRADTGSLNNGSLYSYGAAASTDRALGSVASGSSRTINYGVVFHNTGTSPVQITSVAYTGEQWRYGSATANQKLTFDYEVSTSLPLLNDGSFSLAPALDFVSPVTSGTSGPLDGNAAANRTAISGNPSIVVPADSYVLLRWSDIDDASSDNGLALDDLTVSWTSSIVDTSPPAAVSFSPADNKSNVSVDYATALVINFSESVQLGTGNVDLKKVSDNTTVQSFDVTDLSRSSVANNVATFSLSSLAPFLAPGTDYYVTIAPTAIKDLAGNAYAGIAPTDKTTWNFTTAAAPAAPTVVINKYDKDTDEVELLVVGTGVPGATVSLQGMILKDFSGDMASDNGGSFTFSTDPKWSAVPVGTLIDLTFSGTSPDVNYSDFVMTVGLQDPTYFTSAGSFNIADDEMVMIKASGSPVEGTTGGIYALAGGAAGQLYIDFAGAKAIAPSGGANVAIKNTLSTLSDFMSDFVSSDAEAGNTSAFGSPNTSTNALYIANLRGVTPGDGDGTAFVTNVTTGSAYIGSGAFAASQTGQTAQITLNAYTAGVTLNKVTVVVPATLGTPGTVTLSGAGSTGATFSKSGSTITITNAVVTSANPLVITIGALVTPASPTGLTDTGNTAFTVSTAANAGALTPLAVEPAVIVPIPISSLRDVDTNGLAFDANETVAVTGVVTEGNFSSTAGQVSGFLQDATGGINIFSRNPDVDPGLVRGTRYTVVGKVSQFNGLTEIVPSTVADVINLGAATEVVPEVVTLDTLFANPESYEGKLIKVQGLTRSATDTHVWAGSTPVTLVDSGTGSIDVFVQGLSTARTEPVYPADVTGVFSQFDSSSPYTGNYELLPRDQDDLSSGTTTPTNNYSTWAAAHGITGEDGSADHDKDGLTNLLEYALGLNPTATNGSPGVFNAATKTITFTKGTEAVANADVTYVIQTSPDLVNWTTATSTSDATSISFPLPTGQTKIFARLIVAQVP